MNGKIVSITKKGQATIPAEFRKKYGLERKALVIDTGEGLMVRPLPDPEEEMGSLKEILAEDSGDLLEKSRDLDSEREKKLEEMA